VPIGAPLHSLRLDAPPIIDGRVDDLWDQAPALDVPLHYGLHGDEPAGLVELRSLHDAERVYFLARWPAGRSQAAGGEPNVYRNLMTVHWRLVPAGAGQVSGESTASESLAGESLASESLASESLASESLASESLAGEGLACTVGCHTVTASGDGRLVGIRSETIPPGLEEDLPAAGGWSAAASGWLLEWSRPKVSPSPYDQDLHDPDRGYRFFVKLFLGLEDRPDPVSDVHELRLGR
jgi:hypothetical protein